MKLAAVTTLALLAAARAASADPFDPLAHPPEPTRAGAIAYLAGTIDDIYTAPKAADRYNEEHASHATLVPTVQRGGGGLAVAGTF